MCSAHTPKQQTAEQKPLVYMGNAWLDGTGNFAVGRNQLRLDLGSNQQPLRMQVNTQAPAPQTPAASSPSTQLVPVKTNAFGLTGLTKNAPKQSLM